MTGRRSNHGITVDPDGNVWLGANGAGQPRPGAGQRGAVRARRARRPRRREGGGEKGHLSRQLHAEVHRRTENSWAKSARPMAARAAWTPTMCAASPRSASCRMAPLVAADGYGNHRVSVWDPKTMKIMRMWGAYGKPPERRSDSALRCELAAVRQSGALRPAVE